MACKRLACLLALAALALAAAGGSAASAAARHAHRHHHAHCASPRHPRGRAGSFRTRHRPGRHRRRHHRRCLHRRTGLHRHRSHHRRQLRSTAADGGCADTGLIPTAADLDRIRAATLCLVNRERVARGERPLRDNARLAVAAQAHSESMSSGGYFDHVDPSGRTPLDRMRAAGYVYSANLGYEVGENIAWATGSLSTPRAVVAAWMGSPGHRANILDASFRDTAVGVSAHLPASMGGGGPGGIYTEDFGTIITG